MRQFLFARRHECMTSPFSFPDAGEVARLLRTAEQTRHKEVQGAALDPRVRLLREWQVRRLVNTYRDLLENPRYAAACEFFISDIYAARDFSQRNYDMRQMYQTLRRFMPASLIHPLALAIELHDLTVTLDEQLLDVLVNTLGMGDQLTVEMYAEAYRRCNNYAVRVRQIEMIVEIGQRVETLVNIPFSASVLKLAHAPAVRTGWAELHSFLERGYTAFKHMRGAHAFLETIHEREIEILDRIYARHPAPFDLDSNTRAAT
jgi:hypothetical protein